MCTDEEPIDGCVPIEWDDPHKLGLPQPLARNASDPPNIMRDCILYSSEVFLKSEQINKVYQLSKEERQVLHWLWSTSRELSGKAKRLSSEFDKLKPMVDDLPDGINLDKKSIEKISEILENDKIFIELGNFAAQFASMMTMIIGGHTISELGFTDDNTFESQEEILEYYKNNPQAILDL